MKGKEMVEPELYGRNLFGEVVTTKPSGPIASKFLFSPFSVLDTRCGEWQERKYAWIEMGIKGEVGRSAKAYNCHEWMNKVGDGQRGGGDGTSIFDPVLCEVIYRWFCPPGGQVVDPFAGGSVRGVVAGSLGMNYWGCDLRQEQIDANNAQIDKMPPMIRPDWICGDSMETLQDSPIADIIFSCPPYGDLEKYSDNPKDLSSMEYHTFMAAYKRIIFRSCCRLKDDRFACFVVGDFRDEDGFYRNFVSDTIGAFLECGMKFYNEAILVTAIGSLPIRITKQFESGRKLGKCHQNILVFCKGDPRKATRVIVGGQ